MATTASNVQVAVTGGVYVAPTGTALPSDPSASLNVAFDEVGYVAEDGITQSTDDETTEIKAWQNGDIVRRVQNDHSFRLAFTMLETNETTLAQYYGNYAAGVVEVRSGALPRQAWVFHVIDGDAKLRIVCPDAQVVERGEIVYRNDEAIGYMVTLECYPDTDGVKAYIYLDTSSVSA
jgi:hypothetical protein